MARVTKVDQWLSTGEAECQHHGLHGDWKFQHQKQKRRGDRVEVFRALVCRKCNRERVREYNTRNPTYQDDYRFTRQGHIMRLLAYTRRRARASGRAFELDYQWVIQELERQDNRCAYTGRPFAFGAAREDERVRWNALSIDQFEPGKGYTKANSRLVGAGVNTMKYDIPFDEFVAICRDVAAVN